MPALFKSIGSSRRSKDVADCNICEPDENMDWRICAAARPQAVNTHDLSFRSAALIGQARQQDRVLFVGI